MQAGEISETKGDVTMFYFSQKVISKSLSLNAFVKKTTHLITSNQWVTPIPEH